MTDPDYYSIRVTQTHNEVEYGAELLMSATLYDEAVLDVLAFKISEMQRQMDALAPPNPRRTWTCEPRQWETP